MPTIRISNENYGYILGIAAKLQVEENKQKTPNDAIDHLIKAYKLIAQELRDRGYKIKETTSVTSCAQKGENK